MKGEDKITTRSCVVEIKEGIQSYGNALIVVLETKDSIRSKKESEIYLCTIIESYINTAQCTEVASTYSYMRMCTIYFSYCFVTKLTFHRVSVERQPIR